ncbi:Uncharacterised protein r2_g1129 [Pycnogonum litorale]
MKSCLTVSFFIAVCVRSLTLTDTETLKHRTGGPFVSFGVLQPTLSKYRVNTNKCHNTIIPAVFDSEYRLTFSFFSDRIFTALEELKVANKNLKKLFLQQQSKQGAIAVNVEDLPQNTFPLLILSAVDNLKSNLVMNNDLQTQVK